MNPTVRFVVGGVQKGGTTALASFIGQHPQIRLPAGKEAHVFDDPGYDDDWDTEAVNRRYEPHFGVDAAEPGILHGDATPIYCFHPLLIRRIARYNPAMCWILILRHPVDRAVSHYRMERARGDEAWPLWLAAMSEKWRLAGRHDDFSTRSRMRHFSYLSRGDYARQLDAVFSSFPREQVLLLRNEELAATPEQVLQRVWSFLGLAPPDVAPTFSRVFDGGHEPLPQSAPVRKLLGLLLRARMRDAARRYGIRW